MSKTFICQGCRRIVQNPLDRVVVSEDHMREDGNKRFHRITTMYLCVGCSGTRERELRPRGPDTSPLFGSKG